MSRDAGLLRCLAQLGTCHGGSPPLPPEVEKISKSAAEAASNDVMM